MIKIIKLHLKNSDNKHPCQGFEVVSFPYDNIQLFHECLHVLL